MYIYIYNNSNEKLLRKKYEPKFQLISPTIAWQKVGDFLESQNKYAINYQNLKDKYLELQKDPNIKGTYGIYFEDLNTGAWIGINKRDDFVPASLLKVPLMVATLKDVESGEITLETTVQLHHEDLDTRSGSLWTKGAGYEISVKELLTYLIKESDNTAVLTLYRNFLTVEEINEAKLAMGLPTTNEATYDAIGPKQYSNILRSLYYSAYLRRTFSELGLSIMSETDYNQQIPAGVPDDVQISHKIGFFYEEGKLSGHHDCGIIYHPQKPYILCVMSKHTTLQEANYFISEVSRITYEHVDSKVRE
jgi:beta-lactamase class A